MHERVVNVERQSDMIAVTIGRRIVRAAVDWNMLDPDVPRWQIDQNPSDEFIHALFEMRGIIEPAAAARAAQRATDLMLASSSDSKLLQHSRRCYTRE
jgi:DNA-binding FadR family transcriptional regulator